MSVHVGDTIVVESESTSKPRREGVIEEVLHEDPSRVRVRWQDGHTSILTPSAGVASITPPKTQTKSQPAKPPGRNPTSRKGAIL